MSHLARRLAAAMAGACVSIVTFSSAHACLPSELQDRLSQVRSNFGEIKVISTHRPGATIAGTNRPSYHRWCRAVDFRPPPGKYAAVVAWLHANHNGGVGTYSTGHIHIDNGPHVRFNKGWSGGSVTFASSSGRVGRSRGTASAGKGRRGGESDWTSRVANSQ